MTRVHVDNRMRHRLVAVGWTGSYRVYLDVPREDAIRRYVETETAIMRHCRGSEDYVAEVNDSMVIEFEFEDEFGAYEVSKEL